MKVSTANLTLSQAESLERRGYIIEIDGDNEWCDVFKPSQKLEYWQDDVA